MEPVKQACRVTRLITYLAGVYSSNSSGAVSAKHVRVCVAPMPRLTVFNSEYQGGTRQRAQGGWDSGPKWMEEVKDGVESEAVEKRKLQRYVQ